MKKIAFNIGIVIVFMTQLVSAAEFGFQPRLKTGTQYYKYTQDAFVNPPKDPAGIFPDVLSDIEFSDILPFIGGGLTLFIDRIFADFDIQHAFDGQDSDRFSTRAFAQGVGPTATPTLFGTDTQLNTDFDRTDWAVSLGYSVTDSFIVFAGYKRAKTDYDADLTGEVTGFQVNNLAPIPFLTGSLIGKFDQELEYDGPFVGMHYTWEIKQGFFLEGVVDGNFAVAFMDGSVDLAITDTFVTNQTGAVVPVDFQSFISQQGNLKGDTVGLSLGLFWKGFTPVDGLIYSVGIAGYRYDFDSDKTADFSETQVRFDLGLAYAFDFSS